MIEDVRGILGEEEQAATQPEGEYKGVRLNKTDRASHKVGYLLSTPPEDMSRKKMLKMIPHMQHHFEKGHGKGEGEYGTVDTDDLATLGRKAVDISNHANSVTRMPGPANHLAAHLTKHVANCHDRMSQFWRGSEDDESADLHANEAGKFHHLSHEHSKKARRHGFGY